MKTGLTYAKQEAERLKLQSDRLLNHLRALAIRGLWQTVEELCQDLEKQYPGVPFPRPSISTQCRNLRKEEYGSHDVRGDYMPYPIYKYRLFEDTAIIQSSRAAVQEKLFDMPQQSYREEGRR